MRFAEIREPLFRPLENSRVGRNEIVAASVSRNFIMPLQGLQRLEKPYRPGDYI